MVYIVMILQKPETFFYMYTNMFQHKGQNQFLRTVKFIELVNLQSHNNMTFGEK